MRISTSGNQDSRLMNMMNLQSITYAEHFCLLANMLLTRGSGHCLLLYGQSTVCIV